MVTEKIQDLNKLAVKLAALKEKNRRVVLCHGVFDLMHPGHILHFQAAKKHGDVLVVTVTPDQHVNKGPHRPVFNHRLRMESIAALECVDYVALNQWPTAVETILKLKPNFYVKGQDYSNGAADITGKIKDEIDAVKKVLGKVIFTNEEMFSSSHLINKFFSTIPHATQEYLNKFREKYSADDILGHLKSLSNLRVLVVGEAILDQYCYCQPLGKSPKETIVASKFLSEEYFAGGTLAIANHIAGVCGKVSLITPVGNDRSTLEFFEEKLLDNVELYTLKVEGRPTVTKRRFVEPNFLTKMFEIQYLDDRPIPFSAEQKCLDILREQLNKHDIVVLADFGHGFLTTRLCNEIASTSKFLCVNTQTNSANLGFNPATKYKNVDYVAIDEPELKLALRTKYGDIKEMAKELKQQINTETLLVSRGPNGSMVISRDGTIHETPVMSTHVVDRTGAGDALFALTSPCAYKGLPPDVLGFIGNCAGAIKVGTVCNRDPINRISLSKFITAILK
jgi:rfaE bifunctional protein kinase chain/domain/rfaE bifunctional protein nucleotidyltransferase chain/domain